MFNKKEASTSYNAGSTTLVSKNTEVVGDIIFSGNLMIEGRVKGNVYTKEGTDGEARLLESGVVEGELRVPTLVINGTINGNVYSSKHIELASKAEVNGNVHYSLIEVVKGAQVNGNMLYSGKSSTKDKDSKKSPLKEKENVVEPTPIDAKVAAATAKQS